jgi:hypothetical protein
MLFLKVVLVVSKSQCEWVKNTDASPPNHQTNYQQTNKPTKQQTNQPPNQPGPTFTKVTAPGHENDPGWTNKVARDGKIVVLGTGFTDAVTAEFSTDGTPETFNVTARTSTSITGQIAGGLEAGGTLVMELKDGDNVIDTAAVEVVE